MVSFSKFLLAVLTYVVLSTGSANAQTAKKLFGNKPLPAAMQPAAYGFYSKGCISGAVAIPIDGPNWQAMRLSRNRRWGHPQLISLLEDLSIKAKRDGWNGLMVGDISQPRGGPMLTGHRSHQMGLDADIWFNPMPKKRLTYKERENLSAVSVLKTHSNYVDKARWTKSHTNVLKHAASYRNVERVFVHPGVKKHLCDTVKGERNWLKKIRPIYGHHYHFHIRMGCPKGSPNCRKQKAPPNSIGCDKTLAWWFKSALGSRKPVKKTTTKKKKSKPAKPRRQLKMSNLPDQCKIVLKAKAPSLEQATYKPVHMAGFAAPEVAVPKYSAAAVLKGKPIEASKIKTAAATNVVATNITTTAIALPSVVPVPTPRPVDID